MRHSFFPFSFWEAHLNEPQDILPGELKRNFIFLIGISFNLLLDFQNNWVMRILACFLKDFDVL